MDNASVTKTAKHRHGVALEVIVFQAPHAIMEVNSLMTFVKIIMNVSAGVALRMLVPNLHFVLRNALRIQIVMVAVLLDTAVHQIFVMAAKGMEIYVIPRTSA